MIDAFGIGAGDVAPITYLGGSMGGSDIIGGVINGVATLGAAGINAASQHATNESNQKIAAEANELQKQMFDQSLSFEERKFAEQQYENALARLREDTEVTRRMADLANAGINPLLAGRYDSQTGWGSIAGGVINGFTPTTIPNIAPRISEEAIASTGRGITEALSQKEQRKSNETIAEAEHNIQRTNAEANKLNAETNKLVAETNKKLGESKDNREWKEYYQSILNFNSEMEHKTAELNQRKAEHIETIRDHKTRLIAENNWKEAENLINEAKNKIMDRANSINADKAMSEDEYRKYLKELDNKKFEFEKKVGTSSEARNWVNSIWGNLLETAKLILTRGKNVSINNTYTGSNEQYHYGIEYRAGTINGK